MINDNLNKVETKLWLFLLLTILSSFSMYLSFYVMTQQTLDLVQSTRGVMIVWSAHIPLLLGVYFRWRGIYITSTIGWLIIWIGYITYSLQENQGMKDLVIISWLTISWIVTQSMAIVFQGLLYLKKRKFFS